MSFLDKLRKKATETVDSHGDQIASGIDKAAAKLDQKTGGKYADQIAKGTGKAKHALDSMDGKRDDMPRQRGGSAGAATGDAGDQPASFDAGHSDPTYPETTGSPGPTQSDAPVEPGSPKDPGLPGDPVEPPDPQVVPSTTPDGPQTVPDPNAPEPPAPEPGTEPPR